MNISIRKAEPEDAENISGLYKQVWGGKYPLNEFIDIGLIKERLNEEKDVWYLAFSQERCIGSAVCTLDKDNNSAELGRAVVSEEFRGKSISKQLYEIVREESLNRGVDILWALIRNKATYEISKNDGLALVGYSESYILDKGREALLFGLRITEEGKRKRIVPPCNEVYGLKGVKRIVQEMKLQGKEGEYPGETIAKVSLKGEPKKIEGIYHPKNKSFAATFMPGEDFLPEYFEATVLADKIKHIRFLQSIGFSIAAFLPGWFQKEGSRYDCVLMAKNFASAVARDTQLEPILENIISEFKAKPAEEKEN